MREVPDAAVGLVAAIVTAVGSAIGGEESRRESGSESWGFGEELGLGKGKTVEL